MVNNLKKKISSSIISILIFLIFVAILYGIISNATGKIAFIGNRAIIRIVSSSMEPTIPTNEYIIVKKVNNNSIKSMKKGDVIVFYSNDPQIYRKFNTHRIVEIINKDNKIKFKTKGDNNPSNDALLTSSNDVVAIYKKNCTVITKIANFFKNKAVFLVLILIPATALLIFSIVDIIKKSKSIKMDILVNQEVEKIKKNENKNK